MSNNNFCTVKQKKNKKNKTNKKKVCNCQFPIYWQEEETMKRKLVEAITNFYRKPFLLVKAGHLVRSFISVEPMLSSGDHVVKYLFTGRLFLVAFPWFKGNNVLYCNASFEESFSFAFFIRSCHLILLSHCVINSARLLLKSCRIFFISGSYQKLFIKEVLSL